MPYKELSVGTRCRALSISETDTTERGAGMTKWKSVPDSWFGFPGKLVQFLIDNVKGLVGKNPDGIVRYCLDENCKEHNGGSQPCPLKVRG